MTRTYAEINNGDFEKGLRDFCDQIEIESNYLISEMIETPILLGLSLKSIIATDPEDLLYIATTIFWAILGKEFQDLWPTIEFTVEKNNSIKLVMQESICMFCVEENELTDEDFGGFNFGEILGSVIRGILQALEDYMGNEYVVTTKETKCFMRGDPYGEITVWLKPKR